VLFLISSSPCKNVRFKTKQASTHSAPVLFIRLTAAVAVPPVAIKSSIRRTLGFSLSHLKASI